MLTHRSSGWGYLLWLAGVTSYKPWLTIQDVASHGRSHRIAGIRTGRVHHFLSDTVHRSGWVSSPKRHLQDYFGNPSTYLFFNKYRTIEAMTEWFQQQENRINSGEIAIGDVIATAGITPKESQSDEQKVTMLAQK